MNPPPAPRKRRPIRRCVEPLEQRLLMARAVGIDVYSGQGTINWTSVKNSGISFAWTKATEGVGFTDSKLATNMTGAKNAGVLIGGYDFGRWDTHLGTSGASDEENYFWSKIQPYIVADGAHLAPVIDLEGVPDGNGGTINPVNKGYTKATFSAWANQWCSDLVADAAAIGIKVTPIIYTGVSFASTNLDSTVSQQWPLWMANYNGQAQQTGGPNGTSPWSQWQFWQNSSTGTIPGISGACDTDVLHGDGNVLKNYVIGSAGRWSDGTWVRVNTGALNAWNDSTSNSAAPYNDTATAVPMNTVGKILHGPVFANSFQRWQVQYNNGVTGWSAEYQDGNGVDWLVTATPTAATNPNVTGTINSLPANFTWTASSNVSSYDVYLDGVKKATVTTNSWTHTAIADGAHTWHVIASNGGLAADSATWSFTLDTVAPAASYGAQTPSVGAATLDFTVNYADATSGLLASSFDSSDVTVTGPNGYTAAATFISVNTAGNGSPRTVTYRIAAPGGSWNVADNGTYTVSQNTSQVKDVANNFRAAGTIGTFSAALPFAYISGGTLQIEYIPGTGIVTLTTDGSSNLVATENTTSLSFAPGSFNDIVVHGSSNNDTVVVATNLTKPLLLDGQTGSDTINIANGGSFTFNSDAALMSANLSVIVAAGGSANFAADQHLDNLIVNGVASVSGAGVTLVARSLSAAGVLDLGNQNLIVNSIGSSPLGSWNGSSYTGVTGLIASGRNGGSWDGPGLRTSAGDSLHTLAVAEASDVFHISGNQTALFAGETVDATSVLVNFTYAGDANLDGQINVDDYGRLDFNAPLAVTGYFNGDLNYDGKVNIDDYGIIDFNITIQGPPL